MKNKSKLEMFVKGANTSGNKAQSGCMVIFIISAVVIALSQILKALFV